MIATGRPTGASEGRRRFLDIALAQVDRAYVRALRRYQPDLVIFGYIVQDSRKVAYSDLSQAVLQKQLIRYQAIANPDLVEA